MKRDTHRALLAVLLLAAACSVNEPEPYVPIAQLPRELTADEQALIGLSNGFAFGLLREVRAREERPNVFLSPLSASMALGMATNGAGGNTLDQMRQTLGFGDLSMDQVNQAYRSLIDLLVGLDPRVEFRNANSVWVHLRCPLREEFLALVRQYFDAEAANLDFSDPATLDRINDWVSRGTNGHIDSILDSIDPEFVVFLINAIYFEATWVDGFAPEDTAPAPFYCADGSERSVMMMRLDGDFGYLESDLFRAVDLRYGGGAYSMVVLLPRESHTLDEVVAALDAPTWDGWMDEFQEFREFSLRLPRFELEYEVEEVLEEALESLGMADAFDESKADFSPMSSVPLYIDLVKQKTFVEVDEQGTRAAAATIVGDKPVSANPYEPMVVDRPFLFAIRERFSGTTLFIGTIGALPTD